MQIVVEHDEQHRKEQDADAQDASPHLTRDDEGIAPTRLVAHHLARGRQRRQCHGGKGVHDEVHPEYLCHRQRQLGTNDRPAEHQQQRRHIDHQLEEEEPLYVLIERTAPHHGIHDRAERVVEQCHVAGFFRHAGATAQR